jgi:hypothetical protein
VCGVPVKHRDQWRSSSRGECDVEDPGSAVFDRAGRPALACTASNSRPGLVTHTAESTPVPRDSRRSAACSASVVTAPIAAIVTAGVVAADRWSRVRAGHDLPPTPLSRCLVRWNRGEGLVDRLGRQPQVFRCAVGRPRRASDASSVPTRCRSRTPARGDESWLFQTDRRCGDRLVCSAFGRQGGSGRRADQDRLADSVGTIGPRLQGALDERVVEHPDRQQWLTPAAPGGAEFPEQPDEVESIGGWSRCCRICRGAIDKVTDMREA